MPSVFWVYTHAIAKHHGPHVLLIDIDKCSAYSKSETPRRKVVEWEGGTLARLYDMLIAPSYVLARSSFCSSPAKKSTSTAPLLCWCTILSTFALSHNLQTLDVPWWSYKSNGRLRRQPRWCRWCMQFFQIGPKYRPVRLVLWNRRRFFWKIFIGRHIPNQDVCESFWAALVPISQQLRWHTLLAEYV